MSDTPDPAPREPTRDDVKPLGTGRGVALGCSVLVLLLVAAFWFVRGVLLR